MNVGLITARNGSKGIPGKNLIDLNGKPLLDWTAIAAINSNLDRVVLSTNDSEIASRGKLLGLEVPFIRPNFLASDTALSVNVVRHAIQELGLNADDSVMLLQPTSPFRTIEDINSSIFFLDSRNFDSAISVVPVEDHHPARMLKIVANYLERPNLVADNEHTPRQELSKLFVRNGAIYHSRVNVVNSGVFLGFRCAPILMSRINSINIDSQFDLEIARLVARDMPKFQLIDRKKD
jgi:CMP-N,N'-diacetyllegionaminic acid synthase